MTALCLYAFATTGCEQATASVAASAASLAGLHAVICDGLAAIVMPASADAYTEQNLGDQAWILREATRQCEALTALFRHGPLMPVRFGALFASHQAVRGLLTQHRALLLDALSGLAGKGEWSLRATVDPLRLAQWLSVKDRHTPSLADEAGPGRRYLEQRRLQQLATLRMRDWLAAQISTLQALAQSHALRWQPSSRHGGMPDDGPFWQASLLVDDGEAHALQLAVERLQRDWPADAAQLALAGPWPAYSFCPPLPA